MKSEIMRITNIFRARIVDVPPECLAIEVVGTLDKNEALLDLFRPFGIDEMTRTGRVALHRGALRRSACRRRREDRMDFGA